MKNDWQALRNWIIYHPWQAILASMMVVAALASGLPKVAMTVDYRVYFGPENPDLLAFDYIEHVYEQKEVVFIAAQALEGDLFTPTHLTALRELSDKAWLLPFARRVDSVANFQHMYSEADDIIIDPLIPAYGEITQADADRIRAVAMNSEDLKDRMLSSDGKIAALRSINPLPRDDLKQEVQIASEAVYGLVDAFEAKYPTIKLHVSGVIALNNAMAEVMSHDMTWLYPLAYFSVFFCLWFFFRSTVPAAITMLTIGLATAGATGASGHMGIVINSASMASLLIIMTLAVADCVHVLMTYYQELGKGDKHRAMMESLRVNIQPVMLTSATTLIGFLALNTSDSPPFRDLGNIVAAGVLLAMVLSLLLLPALIILLPQKAVVAQFTAGDELMTKLGKSITSYPGRYFVVTLVGMALLATGLPLNRMGDDYSKYFDEDIKFRNATDFMNENLSGMQMISFSLDSGETDGVNSPEFIAHATRFAEYWETKAETRKVESFVTLHRRLNRTFHGDDPAWYKTPESSELAAQYLFFYELSLPEGLSLNTLFDQDRQRTRFIVLLDNMEAWKLEQLNLEAREWAASNLPAGMVTDGTSVGIMFARIAQRNFESMIQGTSIALLLICLVLMIVLRAPLLGIISMIPNMLPLVMAFGLWGYIDGRLGMSLAIVGSMTLGIVVDDTVHLLSKYQRARRENGATAEEAIQYAFRRVGMALLLTTGMLILGFGILAQSAFMMTASMALMTLMTILIALVIDFLFLPPLLMFLARLTPYK
ncbi:MAG: putative RND superfamily exporter protein [Gammaproteobacteria bacterium]|jgi:predicted RND superfamily exporter protein